jgi:hypothetical protein
MVIKDSIRCEVEETIAAFEMPNNNTFPLWSYGAPTIVRQGEDVYATIPEVSKDVPPMCNTRLQLFRKQGESGWQRIFANPIFDQREPCPIARLGDGSILVSINPAVTPFRSNAAGSEVMWYCEPYLLRFPEDEPFAEVLKPQWDTDWPFTDHSYRGLATDPSEQSLLVMNIEGYQWKPGPQGRYHWAFRDGAGRWANQGLLEFPLRCCYPCISLKDRRVNVVAISDTDEPNSEWMEYKRDFAGIPYDFDFRKLYFAWADDIEQGGFHEPVLIESVDQTAGHIKHFDLYVDADNVAHILYLVRNFRQPFMRDRFFPGQTLTATLKTVRVKDGVVQSEHVLAHSTEDLQGSLWSYGPPPEARNTTESFQTNVPVPLHAAYHAAPDGRLYVVYALGGVDETGSDLAQNYLVEITNGQPPVPLRIEMDDPLKIFYTAAARIGSTPSDSIDLFGTGKRHPDQIRYARIQVPHASPSR